MRSDRLNKANEESTPGGRLQSALRRATLAWRDYTKLLKSHFSYLSFMMSLYISRGSTALVNRVYIYLSK